MIQKLTTWTSDTLPTKRYRHGFFWLAMILVTVPCLAQTAVEKTEENAQSVAPAPAATKELDRDQELVDEINGLRMRLGGGVADQLQELFPESEQGQQQLQQDFNQHLRELAQGVASPQASKLELPQKRVAPEAGQALRDAARQLDSVAADLEDHQFYPVADRLRVESAKLRQLAR